MVTTPNMGLTVWNSSNDNYSRDQLADNLARIDQHDHAGTRGVQIPTGGIRDGAITRAKLAPGTGGTPDDNTVTTAKLVDGAVTFPKLGTDAVQNIDEIGRRHTNAAVHFDALLSSANVTGAGTYFFVPTTANSTGIVASTSALGYTGIWSYIWTLVSAPGQTRNRNKEICMEYGTNGVNPGFNFLDVNLYEAGTVPNVAGGVIQVGAGGFATSNLSGPYGQAHLGVNGAGTSFNQIASIGPVVFSEHNILGFTTTGAIAASATISLRIFIRTWDEGLVLT